MTNYNYQQLGENLKYQLEKDCDITRISRWAYGLFYDNRDELTPEIKSILKDLARMEDDPQFEYTEQELRLLADFLIKGENDPLKRINERKK